MYFNLNPIKVSLIEIGGTPRKCKYIRIQGPDVSALFKSLIDEIRALVDLETNANNVDFYCVWTDYANDEIQIRTIQDFWCWMQFLALHPLFYPEVQIKVAYRVAAPVPQPYLQTFVQQPAFHYPNPRYAQAQFRPNGAVFFNVRAQQAAQSTAYRPVSNGYQENREEICDRQSNENIESMNLSPAPSNCLPNERHLSPKQADCLRRLRNKGCNDISGTLVRIVEEVDGDFDKAYAIVSEPLEDTEDESDHVEVQKSKIFVNGSLSISR